MSPYQPVRPGDLVKVIDSSEVARREPRVFTGITGTVIATRPLIDDQVLVKFPRIGGNISISKLYLEVL